MTRGEPRRDTTGEVEVIAECSGELGEDVALSRADVLVAHPAHAGRPPPGPAAFATPLTRHQKGTLARREPVSATSQEVSTRVTIVGVK